MKSESEIQKTTAGIIILRFQYYLAHFIDCLNNSGKEEEANEMADLYASLLAITYSRPCFVPSKVNASCLKRVEAKDIVSSTDYITQFVNKIESVNLDTLSLETDRKQIQALFAEIKTHQLDLTPKFQYFQVAPFDSLNFCLSVMYNKNYSASWGWISQNMVPFACGVPCFKSFLSLYNSDSAYGFLKSMAFWKTPDLEMKQLIQSEKVTTLRDVIAHILSIPETKSKSREIFFRFYGITIDELKITTLVAKNPTFVSLIYDEMKLFLSTHLNSHFSQTNLMGSYTVIENAVENYKKNRVKLLTDTLYSLPNPVINLLCEYEQQAPCRI